MNFFFSNQRFRNSQFFEQQPHKLTRNASALLPFAVRIQFIRRKRLPDAECTVVNHRYNRGGLIPLLPHLPAMHQAELPRGVILRRKPKNSGYFIIHRKNAFPASFLSEIEYFLRFAPDGKVIIRAPPFDSCAFCYVRKILWNICDFSQTAIRNYILPASYRER